MSDTGPDASEWQEMSDPVYDDLRDAVAGRYKATSDDMVDALPRFACELCGKPDAGVFYPICDRCDDLDGWIDEMLKMDFE